MTAVSNQMITRCPKCSTAFRITESQLKLAKGTVRCGSCLTIFKATENLTDTMESDSESSTGNHPTPSSIDSGKSASSQPIVSGHQKTPGHSNAHPIKQAKTPAAPITSDKASTSKSDNKSATKKAHKISTDDELISDHMDDDGENSGLDGFMDINVGPSSSTSLFDRKIRIPDEDEEDLKGKNQDESWAEMLIEDEEIHDHKQAIAKPKTQEQLADEDLIAANASPKLPEPKTQSKTEPKYRVERKTPLATPAVTPGIMFNLVGESESDYSESNDEAAHGLESDAFKQAAASFNAELFETPDDTEDSGTKRQVKTQPKIRAYDGERSSLLMNIIPAPIEFSVKNIRHWYQNRLWPSVSAAALVILLIQVAWFKFDYFSRVEPYRTAYALLCPYMGCKVPTLVDTSQIKAFNLVVRQHPETPNALAVDVMILNDAPFDQPFPDLVLVFTDIDENHVASRRFTSKEYLGGELAGRELMPQEQPIHLTMDLVDPGPRAENYHIYIPR